MTDPVSLEQRVAAVIWDGWDSTGSFAATAAEVIALCRGAIAEDIEVEAAFPAPLGDSPMMTFHRQILHTAAQIARGHRRTTPIDPPPAAEPIEETDAQVP